MVAGLAALLVGCGKSGATEASGEEAAKPAEEKTLGTPRIVLSDEAKKTAGVELTRVQSRDMQGSFSVPGVVKATGTGTASVTPPVAGKIVRLYVGAGDAVRRGQPLAIVESIDFSRALGQTTEARNAVAAARAMVDRAASEVDLAKARLGTAQGNVARRQALAGAGAFSQAPLQSARRELDEAQNDVASAKSVSTAREVGLDRAERLFKEGLVSKMELEQARLDVAQSRLQIERTTQRADVAKAAFARETSISKAGLLDAKEVQAAEGDARQAALEVRRAEIELRSAKASVLSAQRSVAGSQANERALSAGSRAQGGRLTIVAPIDGVVVAQNATLGQAVERTTEIYDLQNLSSVYVVASVPEKAILRVVRGAACAVTTPALPGKTFLGTLVVVGTRLDPKSRTMPVSCLVRNPDASLRSEMLANVALGTGARARALSVPASALDVDGGSAFVYVESNGGFERRPVRIGRKSGGYLEVVSGLRDGETIASKGVFVLSSESKKDELKGDED